MVSRQTQLLLLGLITLLVVGNVVAVSAAAMKSTNSGSVEFTQPTYTGERGEIIAFTLKLDETDTATILLGGPEVGYEVNITVVDGSDTDNSVTVEFNTLLTAADEEAFSIQTNSDASSPDQITSININNGAPGVLANLSYPLLAWEGDTAQGVSDDEAGLIVQSRSSPTVSVLTAPKALEREQLTTKNSVEEIQSVTSATQVAVGDWLIYKFSNIPGIEGYIRSKNTRTEKEEIVFNTLTTSKQPYVTRITEAKPDLNRDPVQLHKKLLPENTHVVYEDTENIYLLINTTLVSESTSIEGKYITSVNIKNLNPAVEFGESSEATSQNVTFVPTNARVTDANAFARSDGTISGKTSLAPGTQVAVSVQTQGNTVPPFQGKKSTRVTDNRTFNVTFDLSDQSGGDTYSIQLKAGTQVNTTTQGTIQVDNPPNASFQYGPSSPNPDERIQLDASNSTDDIRITEYEWSTNGSVRYKDKGETSTEHTTVSFEEEGRYTLTLQVTDTRGQTDTIEKTVSVSNTPPQAQFKYDRQPSDDLAVKVNANNSVDTDGEVVTYKWYINGEYATTGKLATLTFSEKGQYEIELVVTDNGNKQNNITHIVGVSAPPKPEASVSSPVVATNQLVTFSAKNSTDPDGSVVSFQWGFDDGSSSTGAIVSHSFTEPGEYIVTLSVTDDSGVTRQINRTITVRSPPDPNVTLQPSRPIDNELITLTANVSENVEQVRWDLDNDKKFEATGITTTYRFPEGGRKTVIIEVSTTNDITISFEKTVQVESVDPVVNISWSPRVPRQDQTVVFRAKSSDTIKNYSWDFNNNGTIDKRGQKVTHQFGNETKQVVSLRVTDQYGDTATVSRVVTLQRSATFDLRAASSKVEAGGTVLVTFQASNKLPNTSVITKLSLALPETGVSISGISSGEIAGPGSTTFIEIPPGDDRQFVVQLQFSSPGEYNLDANAVYYIDTTENGDRRDVSVGPIEVSVVPSETSSIGTGTPSATATTNTGTSGFSLVTGIIGLLVMLCISYIRGWDGAN